MPESKRTPAEEDLARLLTERGLRFWEQKKIAGHKIDFIVRVGNRVIQLDINGDRWHHWQKIIDCDRIKIERVLAAGEIPLTVWWSRLKKDPEGVMDTLEGLAHGEARMPWWDWAVELDSLTPTAERRARKLLQKGQIQ